MLTVDSLKNIAERGHDPRYSRVPAADYRRARRAEIEHAIGMEPIYSGFVAPMIVDILLKVWELEDKQR